MVVTGFKAYDSNFKFDTLFYIEDQTRPAREVDNVSSIQFLKRQFDKAWRNYVLRFYQQYM